MATPSTRRTRGTWPSSFWRPRTGSTPTPTAGTRAGARERGLGRREVAAAPEVREPRERRAVQGSDIEEALKAACASLLRKIGDLAETRPDDFKAQELANVAWSFATADLDAPRLYAAAATSATPRLAQFSAQELANV